VPRVRDLIGQERRDCPTCIATTTFTLWESFERGWFGKRIDPRMSAQCTTCGYRVLDQERVIQLPD
jgi:C4-type Zn-finger protein